MNVCNCTIGPPPGGRCNACGAYGATFVPVYPPYVAPAHPILTEERIRQIVREEMARMSADPQRGSEAQG